MPVSIKDLLELGFDRMHSIALAEDGLPRFITLPHAANPKSPAVYLWLEHRVGAEEGEVLYVGKAGKGVARRCVQHRGGFSNSGTGRKNAAALAEILADETLSVTVMGRQAGTTTLFGMTVSLYATEEDALCARFAPRLNRAAFPDVAEHAAAQTDEPASDAVADAPGTLVRIAPLINRRLRVQDEGTQDDMLGQIEAYSPQNLALLERMLSFVEARLLAPEHALKLIGGYTSQVKGCSQVTTLGFGNLVNQNFAPNGWVARIYMADDAPRIAFPARFLNQNARDRVEKARGSFSPTDLGAFFRWPSDFIVAEHLR